MIKIKPIKNYDILKSLCKSNKWTLVGDYWFEDNSDTITYRCCQGVMFLAFYALAILESLEIIFNTYPEDLHNDAVALGIVHIIVVARFHCLQYYKKEIRTLNREVAMDGGKFDITDIRLLLKQHKKIKLTLIFQCTAITTATLAYVAECFRRLFQQLPFVILPVYWPNYDNVTPFTVPAHVFFYLVMVMMMACMISADTLAATHLIIVCYKFVNLRNYFEELNKDFANKNFSTLEMKNKCLDGVLEHRKILQVTYKIRDYFGAMMSLQVAQGSGIFFLLLIKIALSEKITMTSVLLNLGFIMGLLIQLAMYLWNAGEVTYQASLMADAMFHCGWYSRSIRDEGGRDLRRVVLMGCAQAQRPLILKAYGLQPLSYNAFVSILKTTYSIFAVLY